tara:strand:+ start:572 stop:1351 length:780 start_codon:yes stop_codon:yes gene_type:complete
MSNQDRKPLLPKFRAEELPQGQHYAIAAGHFGETGIVLKRIHYGFDYPTRCKGQGCPLCKEVIKKSRDKAAQRYKVNERGVICANVVIADDESLDVVKELGWFSLELGAKATGEVTKLSYVDEFKFDGSYVIRMNSKTAEIGGRDITFLDPSTFDSSDDVNWDLSEPNADLVEATIEFNEGFPRMPDERLFTKLAEQIRTGEAPEKKVYTGGGRGNSGPRFGSGGSGPKRGRQTAAPTFKKSEGGKPAGKAAQSALNKL